MGSFSLKLNNILLEGKEVPEEEIHNSNVTKIVKTRLTYRCKIRLTFSRYFKDNLFARSLLVYYLLLNASKF